MADADEAVVDETITDEVVDKAEDQVKEPESMDEIIEKEAEAEADEERKNEDGEKQDDQSDEGSDDEPDADAKDEESDETDESKEVKDEKPEVDKKPAPEIDKTSFSEVGLEAVPEDYKPESWQTFMKDVVEVVRGEVNKEGRALTEQQEVFKAEVSKVDQGWQEEIEQLTKAGDLPKDSKEQEVATKEVFEYMAKNNKKYEDNPNKQIWSFETAHKLMQASKVTDKRAEEIKTRRRARASATASAENNDGGTGLPRIIKGESMDDIIERELGL
jgi:hypothetical protein